MESLRATEFSFVGRGGRAEAPPPEGGEQGRPRPEGPLVPLVLRDLRARAGTELAAVRGWEAGERHNHAVPFVELKEARSSMGKKALLLVWDNASWHKSKFVKEGIAAHNREVKEQGSGVRIVPCFLPKKSPWLNAIEPKWIHGKRKVVEPDLVLTAHELADRVCEVFGCTHEPHLSIHQEVA